MRQTSFAGLLARGVIVFLMAGLSSLASAQWAASPGDTVRNAFGPQKNASAPMCRGACGMDCPSSCEQDVNFECAGNGKMRRVLSLSCGTHKACREHDDCLDRCSQEQGAGYDCQAYCHTDVMGQYPPEQAVSWAAGGGPYDGEPIQFEYTRQRPDDPEAIYRCPDGAEQTCIAGLALCQAKGRSVDPVFVAYEGGAGGTMRVANFRSGGVCLEGAEPSSVCRAGVAIPVKGEAQCRQAGGSSRCSWYGFEFDYSNAIPGEPLYCSSSGAEGDFLGGVVTKVIESVNADSAANSEFGELLSGLQQELGKGKSLDQVFSGITITTADGQTLGGEQAKPEFAAPGVPQEVALAGSSGHVLVPIFELQGAQPRGTRAEHYIRCLQQGRPVVETTFVLQY
ncbi:hypothetical protein [Seongchinamella sediminis]|uniref:hypothetical protein n=1 Tax=Seongchinamella sediminis TaxID=2283635 RepID=UPI00105855F2|nr:hypothetical protein [Seongchinamella sediminis]